ncbi:MAG: T9SS type A sorting domain-containing protein [Chitinophagales bacterium]
MKTLLFSLLLAASGMLMATNTAICEPSTVYEQLCELNKYWEKQTDFKELLQQKIQFTEHEDLIQLHLQLVEQNLQEKDISHLSNLQKENRKEALKVLKKYALQKQFPKNTRHASITPYFIDDFNTACAVGHLMRESGAVQQAHWIANTMNNAYIEDMPLEELQQWADEMGFDVEELKWIQPAYGVYAFAEVENADCHTANGNIWVDVGGTGGCAETEDMYAWYDYSENTIKRVGSQKDLTNMSAGFYHFQINMQQIIGNYECSPMRFIGINDTDGPKIEAEVLHPADSGPSNGSIELTITNGTPPYSIEWYDFNEQYLGSDMKIENLKGYFDIFMSQPPDYTHRVKVVDANGCKAFKSFYLVDYSTEETPYPLFTFYLQNTIKNQSIGQIHIETFEQLTYQWSHDSNLTSNKAINLPIGDYTVTITDIETQKVFVRNFTILEEEPTDIADRLIGKLNIYPTLASQNIRIDLPSKSGDYLIEVFNNYGQKISDKTTSIGNDNYSLEVNDYPKGIYFVSMSNTQGKFVGKFVKQ